MLVAILEIKFVMIVCKIDLIKNNLLIAFYCFTYVLMPHVMLILYYRLPYCHVSNSALFSTKNFSTLILHRRRRFLLAHEAKPDYILHVAHVYILVNVSKHLRGKHEFLS